MRVVSPSDFSVRFVGMSDTQTYRDSPIGHEQPPELTIQDTRNLRSASRMTSLVVVPSVSARAVTAARSSGSRRTGHHFSQARAHGGTASAAPAQRLDVVVAGLDLFGEGVEVGVGEDTASSGLRCCHG